MFVTVVIFKWSSIKSNKHVIPPTSLPFNNLKEPQVQLYCSLY